MLVVQVAKSYTCVAVGRRRKSGDLIRPSMYAMRWTWRKENEIPCFILLPFTKTLSPHLLYRLVQPGLLVQLLNVGHGHPEEQVHDDDGDDEDEDGEDEVGGEGEELRDVPLVDGGADEPAAAAARVAFVGVGVEGQELPLGVVQVVVLDLPGHHHHHLEEKKTRMRLCSKTRGHDTTLVTY